MIRFKHNVTAPRILDFDLENRPLAYLGSDFTTSEITAIAWGWINSQAVQVVCLGEVEPIEMLKAFRHAYEEADIVTGHYIRKHDLPILNGAMLEYGLAPLSPKLTSDTHGDLLRRKGISASQESLAGMYGLNEHKHHMSQKEWRAANRLTPEGIEQTRRRVVDDVRQHKALRASLVAAKALKPPRVWRP